MLKKSQFLSHFYPEMPQKLEWMPNSAPKTGVKEGKTVSAAVENALSTQRFERVEVESLHLGAVRAVNSTGGNSFLGKFPAFRTLYYPNVAHFDPFKFLLVEAR